MQPQSVTWTTAHTCEEYVDSERGSRLLAERSQRSFLKKVYMLGVLHGTHCGQLLSFEQLQSGWLFSVCTTVCIQLLVVICKFFGRALARIGVRPLRISRPRHGSFGLSLYIALSVFDLFTPHMYFRIFFGGVCATTKRCTGTSSGTPCCARWVGSQAEHHRLCQALFTPCTLCNRGLITDDFYCHVITVKAYSCLGIRHQRAYCSWQFLLLLRVKRELRRVISRRISPRRCSLPLCNYICVPAYPDAAQGSSRLSLAAGCWWARPSSCTLNETGLLAQSTLSPMFAAAAAAHTARLLGYLHLPHVQPALPP